MHFHLIIWRSNACLCDTINKQEETRKLLKEKNLRKEAFNC